MKRPLKPIAVIVLTSILSVFNSAYSQQMTMTLKPEQCCAVKFSTKGATEITIDWGDGSQCETYKHPNLYNDYGSLMCHEYTHKYLSIPDFTAYTVTITGNNITYFACSYNYLTSLDVSKNTALKELYCCGNQLVTLDVSKNTDLIQLICYDNRLISLDVSNNPKLHRLLCNINSLTTLDLSRSVALRTLDCSGNQLTNLNVSKNIELSILICRNNQLTDINISNNKLLEILNCEINLLTGLYTGNNTALRFIYCRINQLSSEALNDLFETLHENIFADYYDMGWEYETEGKSIRISTNPGTADCNKKIAEDKGWTIADKGWTVE